MGCRAWVPGPCPLPGLSLLLLLLLAPLGAHPQAGRVSTAPLHGGHGQRGGGRGSTWWRLAFRGGRAGLGNGSPEDPASWAPHPPAWGPLPFLQPLRVSPLFSPRPQGRPPRLEPRGDGPCLGGRGASPIQPLGLSRTGGSRPSGGLRTASAPLGPTSRPEGPNTESEAQGCPRPPRRSPSMRGPVPHCSCHHPRPLGSS